MSVNPARMRALIRGVRGRFGRTRRPRTAFVLSGGASLGALQVGMLRALYERGIVPDLLVGASAGALNAAFVASRPQTVATADELAAIWCGLRREDVFPVGVRVLIAGLTSRDDHLVPDHGLRQLARQHLQIDRLEQAVVPLHLLTFDLTNGEEVLLSSGPVITHSANHGRGCATCSPMTAAARARQARCALYSAGGAGRVGGGLHGRFRNHPPRYSGVQTSVFSVSPR